jgi:hypothetical protein
MDQFRQQMLDGTNPAERNMMTQFFREIFSPRGGNPPPGR